MVVGLKTTNKNLSINSMRTRVMRTPIQETWRLPRDNSRTTHWRTTLVKYTFTHIRQKQSLKYCAYILMKVHTLDIDSGERDTTIYEYSNNYSVTLKTPLYNVTKLEVVSARIPRNRIINHFNNKFTIHDDFGTYDVELDPLDNSIAGTPSETTVATFVKNAIAAAGCDTVDQVAYSYSKFQFSNVAATNEFNLDFYNGVDGWSSNVMNRTTPNQIFGLNTSNVSSSSSVIKGGDPGVAFGPKTFVLKISTGPDDFNQDSYTNTPFYTGVFMNNDDDSTYSSAQKYYTFHGSTDKLESLPKVPLEVVNEELPPPINIPEVLEDVYKWKEYLSIGIIIFVGIVLLSLMRRRPKLSE